MARSDRGAVPAQGARSARKTEARPRVQIGGRRVERASRGAWRQDEARPAKGTSLEMPGSVEIGETEGDPGQLVVDERHLRRGLAQRARSARLKRPACAASRRCSGLIASRRRWKARRRRDPVIGISSAEGRLSPSAVAGSVDCVAGSAIGVLHSSRRPPSAGAGAPVRHAKRARIGAPARAEGRDAGVIGVRTRRNAKGSEDSPRKSSKRAPADVDKGRDIFCTEI